MQTRRASVAIVVAATLVTVTTVVLGVLGAVNYTSRRNAEWARLRRVTGAQADELAVAVAMPVWNIDRPQIEKILDSQSGAMAVEGIIVLASGKTHARVRDAQRRFVPSDGSFSTKGLLAAERPITLDNRRIGTVRLYTTPLFIERELRTALTQAIITILAIDAFLILSVYWILWRAVLRPLVAIERYAGAVSAGTDAASPSLQPAPTAELESLRVSIETMVSLLDRRYVELQEEAARRLESEERFRTIFDSVNDAIFIIDSDDGAILDMNERAIEMFGHTREESPTLNVACLSSGVEPYTQEDALERIRQARDGGPRIFEWSARHRDGHVFWTEVSTRMATIEGKIRVIVVVRSIGERKEMEEALRRSETMSVMGTLVAGVAHEVRNPLFGMSALLDAYDQELKTAKLTELSSSLRELVLRLTHLMRELLEFGRPVEIAPEPGSLRDLINDVIRRRAAAAESAQVTLRNMIDGALPVVPMDRQRLSQVFENVIDNALQHAPPVRTVSIRATEVVQAGRSWIECTIEDDGDGFQPADIVHVFDPFFTRRESGIGLGMSIVQRIVQEHSGRVSVGNRPDGGAIVTVRLPAAEREVEVGV
jgi:PAS domain S-box-containing protein